ncbi:MAG: hypothetical protein JO337_12235 [Acidimicrobiales bacterium]|nr:hypothetical protein [Acidimicrobiales bacterium]
MVKDEPPARSDQRGRQRERVPGGGVGRLLAAASGTGLTPPADNAGAPAAITAPGPTPPASRLLPRKGLDEPMVASGGPWHGPSLKTAGGLGVPIAIGASVAAFVLAQALIDRRDPKMSRAPQRSRDDTVGFE